MTVLVVRFTLALKVAVRTKLQAHQTHHLKMAHTCARLVNCPYKPSAELAVGRLSPQFSCYLRGKTCALPVKPQMFNQTPCLWLLVFCQLIVIEIINAIAVALVPEVHEINIEFVVSDRIFKIVRILNAFCRKIMFEVRPACSFCVSLHMDNLCFRECCTN